MKIAVLSGKGGTGKTLVAVNLAYVSKASTYIDCDVEEPNGYLFFKPELVEEEEIRIRIPMVREQLCNGCRICVEFCKFNALAYVGGKLEIFENLCHSCGGCILFCPNKALYGKDRIVGKIQRGVSAHVSVNTGILNIGEVSGIPIIKRLIAEGGHAEENLTFIDCPPGSACSVMESIEDADYCILVAEPTLFGAHNIAMVYELVRLFDKPYGVILNKCLVGENPSEVFCAGKNCTILGKIPFDIKLGTLNSNGLISAKEDNQYREMFSSLLQAVMREVHHETAVDSER